MTRILTDFEGRLWQVVATITLNGRPLVKKNSRRLFVVKNKAGQPKPKSQPSAAYDDWAKPAEWEAMAQWRKLGRFKPVGSAEQPVWLVSSFYLPAGAWADLSNLLEGPQDILQVAGVLDNDRWVVSHDRSRRLQVDSLGPRAVIDVLIPA